jgi:hypothetical protein
MTRDFQEKGPGPDDVGAAEGNAPRSKRGRRKEVSSERVAELQARQRAIGLELKRIFDDVTKEPIPKEFLDLLKKIDNEHED